MRETKGREGGCIDVYLYKSQAGSFFLSLLSYRFVDG